MTRTTTLSRTAVALCALLLAAPHGGTAAAQTAGSATEMPLEQRGYALGDMVIGSPDAPVEIVEYSSLLCPFCADFHNDTWPAIRERFVDTGKARLVFRDVFGNQLGLWATMLVRCGGEDAFWESLSAFMAQQSSFLRVAQTDGVSDALRQAGRTIGLSPQRVEACLSDEPFMLRLVEDLQSNMAEREVRSTPTFFINGEMHTGMRSVEAFSALIEDAL